MKIEISTNCKNGEHVFMPASTLTEGRENLVTSFVCRHCLQGVSNNDWNAHLKMLEDQEIAKAHFEMERMIESQKIAALNVTQIDEPIKKRGPKAKAKVEELLLD